MEFNIFNKLMFGGKTSKWIQRMAYKKNRKHENTF